MIDQAQLLRRLENLPVFPRSITRLREITRDERTSAADVEELIKHDPAVTANLLRLINSGYYSLAGSVSSIRHAVVLLGLKRVTDLATAAAFTRVLPKKLAGYEMSASQFWLHNIAVGSFSEELASMLGLREELAFPAGLLHDIGKIALSTFLLDTGDRVLQVLAEDRLCLNEAELEVLGTDHAEVGSRLAEQWLLGSEMATVIRWHHQPQQMPGGARPLVDVIHIADCMAHSFGFGSDVGELKRRLEPSSLERLGVTNLELEKVACECASRIEQAKGEVPERAR